MTFNEYIVASMKSQRLYPEQRVGQTFFNTLANVDPMLTNEIKGSDLDPFYHDQRIPDFLTRVQEVLR